MGWVGMGWVGLGWDSLGQFRFILGYGGLGQVWLAQFGLGRERNLNDPRYAFLVQAIKEGKLPLKATQEISDQIDLQYKMPKDIVPLDWVRDNAVEIANKWIKSLQLK